ncbi:hypothetical protein MKX01_029421 [Papaver californicum]|nr:hypothetical protein MKX01_029421 [Papaver californicum]
MQKLAALHKIREPSTSVNTIKEAKLIEVYGDLPEAKLIESCGDLQGPPPGDSSLLILTPPGPPSEDSSLITLSTPQLSEKSRRRRKRKRKKMQNLAPPHKIVRPTNSMNLTEVGKVIGNFGDLQGPAPGDSSIVISCGDGCAKAVGALMSANFVINLFIPSDCYRRFYKDFKTPRRLKKGRTQSASSQPPSAPIVYVAHPSSTVFECVI